jgi:ABC-type uncharacterized transport system substrate-binding protein
MDRRAFMTGIAGGLLATPRAAEAQSATKADRIGFLSESRQPWDEAFREGLRELGYVTGQNITIEYRYGEGRLERLSSLAAELVRLDVELIVAGGTHSIRAAKETTTVIPIVMAVTADPVGSGFVACLFSFNRRRIADFAAKNRLASMFTTGQSVEAGGLVSYGTSFADLFRRAAVYVDKILKGAKPADLPVEQPTKFELVINLKTAKALGLTIPQSVLARADRLIE